MSEKCFMNGGRKSPVVIGSSVLSSVISFHVMFGPMLRPRGSNDLDHELDITLAIHAAIPDLIKDTQMPRYPGWQLMALARQFERNSRAKPAWQGKIQTAARRRYNSKGPFDDG